MVVPPVITPGSKGKPDAQSHSAPLSPNRSSEPSTSSRTQKPSKTLKNESRVSRMRHTTTHDRRILMMALAAGKGAPGSAGGPPGRSARNPSIVIRIAVPSIARTAIT